MADEKITLEVSYLPEPESRTRRPGKPAFIPPPKRDAGLHSKTLQTKVKVLKQQLQALTPDQRRAVYLKLNTANPISEADLNRAGMFPIRQIGKQIVVALAIDPTLTKLESRVMEYEKSKKPFRDNATLVANLESGPESLSPEERMSDTFAAERAKLYASKLVIVKLQLAPLLPSVPTLEGFKKSLKEGLAKLDGALRTQGTIFECRYSRDELTLTVSARMPGTLLKQMVEGKDWRFVIWFDTLPRFQTVHEQLANFDVTGKTIDTPAPDAPLICVIDSGVLATNALIRTAASSAFSKSFVRDDQNVSDECNHGTGVAGIALYFDLGSKLEEVRFTPVGRLANARILNAKNELGAGQLFSKVLESAIRHFHTLGCRVFNLSVCDRDKPFHPKNPLDVAETLDSLTTELDVLIVVAAGNLVFQDASAMIKDGRPYPHYLLDDGCQILDPSHAVNVLTVGSLATSHIITSATRQPLAKAGHPSPFTRSGPGINGFLKPELLDAGGNIVLDNTFGRLVEDAGCSVVTTCNDVGKLLHRVCGTSYSAPRVAHLVARVLKKLTSVTDGEGRKFTPSANLLRALIVNSATCGSDWVSIFGEKTKAQKFDWQRVCGYGQPAYETSVLVEGNRAILIYQGKVEIDKIVYFGFPVPDILKGVATRFQKRIRVTVAYDPPVRETRTVQYCGTRMQWRLFRGDVKQDDVVNAMSIDEDENVRPESDDEEELDVQDEDADRPKEMKGKYGLSRRSRSTVQHDVFVWKQHKASYSVGDYTLAIVARRNWAATNVVEQRFAVAVAIETDEPAVDIATPIITEIRRRIGIQAKPRVPIRGKPGTRG